MDKRSIDDTTQKLLELLGLDDQQLLISVDVHLQAGQLPTVTTVSLAQGRQHTKVTNVFELHLRAAQQPTTRPPLNLDNLCMEARARLASQIWHAGQHALSAMEKARWARAEHCTGLLREVVDELSPSPF